MKPRNTVFTDTVQRSHILVTQGNFWQIKAILLQHTGRVTLLGQTVVPGSDAAS